VTTVEIAMPRLHPAQRRVLETRQRFSILALGRRFGKTTLAVDLAVRAALEGQPVGWFAPTYQLLAEAWRELKRRLGPVTRHASEVEHRLELLTGGVVECWSLDGPDPARGRKYGRVILDEASIVRDLLARWQAAIRPTLTDLAGDALILGTPKGRNAFWTLYQRGVAGEPGWSSHAGPTADNPHLDPAEIEAARRDLPDRVYRQEYLAEFLEDGSGVFRRVAEAARLQPQERQPGHWYVIGADWAREHDYTALSVVDVTTREQVALERFSQVEWAIQYGRLTALCDRYKPAAILAEENSFGSPVVEHLQRQGLPVRPWTASNATKAAVVDGLALALERGVLGLLDDPVQTAELQAYTAERLPSGLVRYTAPEGMHDDTVIALCLAWEAATSTAPSRPAEDIHFRSGGSRATAPTDAQRRRTIRGPGVNPFATREA
jgi:hypothetical protein